MKDVSIDSFRQQNTSILAIALRKKFLVDLEEPEKKK
jgi:hypothetical protein